MVKKEQRSKAEKIAHLERAIRRFGDSDGKRAEAIAILRGQSAEVRK
jgi:hypothetical protein